MAWHTATFLSIDHPQIEKGLTLTRSAPLLATILVLFGIGYTIDYNSELSCYLQTRRVTGSAPQAPQERPPLECSSSVGERKMHGIAGIGIWTTGNGCGAGDPRR